ncbi:protein GUCD1-like isoform X2 [Olea europaea var. sylvestris]|uniref:protein GUCD1-like isoform X2 n=1 Tax=Olea europaea var. sylvestris TaxID=158386 RepID=UPI000C1D39F2|nr:protein GUCD1-like isoform X2 [Olea europaea var. sylvestris]
MWSLYLLANKFLKLDERNNEGSAGNNLEIIEHYQIKQSPRKDERYGSVLSCFIEVPHINQLRTWDCGLACVLMVLRTLGIYNCNIQELGELCSTTSIWTVDLAYLLQKFSVRFSYCTVTLGANPNFYVETFYKEQLPNDLVRVNLLFQEARKAEINIECRSVSADEISELILSGKYIAIALVDQYKLRCSRSWLEDVYISDFYSGSPGYTGHYVIICGYDAVANEFEIRDPASSRKFERVTSLCLEESRKSFGTDEDILLFLGHHGSEHHTSLPDLVHFVFHSKPSLLS